MYLGYIDESSPKDKSRAVVAGILTHDTEFHKLEDVLAFIREFEVLDEHREKFGEFHTSDLFNGREAFQGIDHIEATRILSRTAEMIATCEITICYGAVDLEKLKETIWQSAQPIAIGSSICFETMESWLKTNTNGELGLIICDNIDDRKLRDAVQQSFRDARYRVMELAGSRGKLKHLHDDLYFGDSKFSVGIQVADICAFLINRHLAGKADTEEIFEFISPKIIKGKCVPE